MTADISPKNVARTVAMLWARPYRSAAETEDEARTRRQEERERGADVLEAVYSRHEDDRAEIARLRAALDGAATALRAARGVIVSKREHAMISDALAGIAEALAGVSAPKETPEA